MVDAFNATDTTRSEPVHVDALHPASTDTLLLRTRLVDSERKAMGP
jgi:hypothetical protein